PAPARHRDRLDHRPPAGRALLVVALYRVRDVLDGPARLPSPVGSPGPLLGRRGAGSGRHLGQTGRVAPHVDPAAADAPPRRPPGVGQAARPIGGRRCRAARRLNCQPYQATIAVMTMGPRAISIPRWSIRTARSIASNAGNGLG